ncbi:PDZ and LIM domain protein 4 [Echinops telfairi]|uniref:PDZ and LIM domain protein 4 n=1 Tax=Echinops telfairi TaxID=9371 RepID=A0AC55CP98_ECHTE|nr:PDZ and LIM domain protein 4 [Echinops telfairi]
MTLVHAGSKAALASLCPGDLIQAINGESTELMTHLEAQNRIKGCQDHLTLSVSRPEAKSWPNAPEDSKAQAHRIHIDPEAQVGGLLLAACQQVSIWQGKLGTPLSGLQGLPECTRCGHGIVGTIVKARDKLYHPECFMCSDCGLNLKQRGYFFLDEQLYCEGHAKERVKPPEGYDVVAVYPNAKVELV